MTEFFTANSIASLLFHRKMQNNFQNMEKKERHVDPSAGSKGAGVSMGPPRPPPPLHKYRGTNLGVLCRFIRAAGGHYQPGLPILRDLWGNFT